jgi:hypothetical protein
MAKGLKLVAAAVQLYLKGLKLVQYSEVKLNCHRTGHGVLMSG